MIDLPRVAPPGDPEAPMKTVFTPAGLVTFVGMSAALFNLARVIAQVLA